MTWMTTAGPKNYSSGLKSRFIQVNSSAPKAGGGGAA